jgi:hypothetical protein
MRNEDNGDAGEGKAVLEQELRRLSETPTDTSFPPDVDAAMIKVTDKIAFSSQPLESQLKGLACVAFVFGEERRRAGR